MSKLIAVWGTPQSGKTTFTVKLANALNLGGKGKSIHSAIAVFPDITTPVVPTVFSDLYNTVLDMDDKFTSAFSSRRYKKKVSELLQ